jgi:hypothetical protein
VIDVAGILRIRRSRGALSGVLLVLLGLWGGLIPFIGPYFHYAYTPDRTWIYTSGRLWLDVLPGIGVVIGGLILLASAIRPVAHVGAWLAAASGVWFAIGTAVAPLWMRGAGPAQGAPVGNTLARVTEEIGFFTGLGAIVVLVAAAAMGRLSVVAARDAVTARETRRIFRSARVPSSTPDEAAQSGKKIPARNRSLVPVGLRRVASWNRSS